ncbi:hypothetical protein CTAYLR_003125 [Chrysophaeum taylorii]|uniref:Proteasome subunit beta n=1 Tax=Chrysophaeum taylorii TaxID=2483200 RepID=A0AAD7UNG9_9STRA|nr:hypothetical protein CTAYLR_003125 [Chrysophaeum taylorii]
MLLLVISVSARFEPYAMNGGSVVAVAGRGFAVVAADRMLVEGYSLRSSTDRLTVVGDACVACAGSQADSRGLVEVVCAEARRYEWLASRKLGAEAVAHLVALALYSRRGFPYLAQTVVAGCDGVYTFDSLGSFARVDAAATGAAQRILQPILDDLCADSRSDPDDALALVERAFQAALRRDVALGATLDVVVLRPSRPPEHRQLQLGG